MMSICKPHIHLWTVNMHFIVLLFIFTKILAHRSDIFDDWENAQVFIYKRRIGLPRPHFDISETYPSCFGILLTSKHVITAISCFFDVTKSNNPNVNSLLEKTLKFDPKKAFVVTVTVISRFTHFKIKLILLYDVSLGKSTRHQIYLSR